MRNLEIKLDSLERIGAISKAKAIDVRFSWPLRAESHLFDFGYHGISNFVDHNSKFQVFLQIIIAEEELMIPIQVIIMQELISLHGRLVGIRWITVKWRYLQLLRVLS